MVALATPEMLLLAPPASRRVALGLLAETVGESLLPVMEKTSGLDKEVAVPSVT